MLRHREREPRANRRAGPIRDACRWPALRLHPPFRALAVVLAALCLLAPTGPRRVWAQAVADQTLDQLVSVDFRNVALSQVINALVFRRNVNILAPPDLNQRVTVKLEGVPWKAALRTILRAFGYGFEEVDGILRVDLVGNLNRTPISRNYEVRFLDAEGVDRFLVPLLSQPAAGRMVEVQGESGQPARRIFIVTDLPQVHTRVEETLRDFDRPAVAGACAVTGPSQDGLMAVTFEGIRLGDAVAALAARLRLAVVWEVPATGTVDLKVANLDLERILDLILAPRRMLYEFDDRLIRIGAASRFQPRTVTRTFTLKYANAIELQRLLASRMTSRGRVEFLISTYGTQAPQTGSVIGAPAPQVQSAAPQPGAAGTGGVPTQATAAAGGGSAGQLSGAAGSRAQPTLARAFVVTDTLQVMRELEEIVKLADVPPSQVGIDLQLVEIQLTRNDALGIRWNLALNGTGASTGVHFPFNRVPSNQPPGGGLFGATGNAFQFGTLSFANLSYILELLAQKNRLRTLSKPSVVTLDQQEATILVGERFPLVQTTQDQFGRQTFSQTGEVQIGIQLRVVPQIMDKWHINLNIHPQVSTRGDLIQNQFPVVQTREVNTQLMVRQGDTAVIAGLIQDRDLRTTQGIPGLMHVGVIGYLFGRKNYERTRSELMIFVTPRIIAYNPGPVPGKAFPTDSGRNGRITVRVPPSASRDLTTSP